MDTLSNHRIHGLLFISGARPWRSQTCRSNNNLLDTVQTCPHLPPPTLLPYCRCCFLAILPASSTPVPGGAQVFPGMAKTGLSVGLGQEGGSPSDQEKHEVQQQNPSQVTLCPACPPLQLILTATLARQSPSRCCTPRPRATLCQNSHSRQDEGRNSLCRMNGVGTPGDTTR